MRYNLWSSWAGAGKADGARKGFSDRTLSGCNHPERVRISGCSAAGASTKGAAQKFAIDYHALPRHWINHVSADARAAYIAGAGVVAGGSCGIG